jgi:hypothetical protein
MISFRVVSVHPVQCVPFSPHPAQYVAGAGGGSFMWA